MFQDPNDINRDPNRDLANGPGYVGPADETGWGLPLAIAAVVLVIGGLFYFGQSESTQTAQNNPAIERTAPMPPAAPPVMPAPPTTAPKQ